MGTVIKHRRGSSLALVNENPVLADGELCFDTDANLFKIGDGVTPWLGLPFVQNPPADGSIHTNKIADDAVTLAKFAPSPNNQGPGFLTTTGYGTEIAFHPTGDNNRFFNFATSYTNSNTIRRLLGAQTSVGAVWVSRGSTGRNGASVAYGNQTFVYVADSGSQRTGRSTNGGHSWLYANSAAEGNAWYSVTFGGGKFVAVANSGTSARAMYSTNNGQSWTLCTVPSSVSTATWTSVAHGNGTFVAVSSNGFVMSSADGITWTQRTPSATSITWQAVTYGNGVFVAVASAGGTRIMTSPDGVTWTSRSGSTTQNWTGIAYGAGYFVVAAFNSSSFMRSVDGITWETRSGPYVSATRVHISFGAGKFVVTRFSGGSAGQYIVVSDDGGWTWWYPVATSNYNLGADIGPNSNSIRGSCYAGGMYVAIGNSQHWTSGAFSPNETFDNVPYGGTTAYARQYSGWAALGDSATLNVGTTAGTVAAGNDSRLSDTRTPTDNTVSTVKIQNNAVTYAKIQNVSATNKLLGRASAGAGAVEEVTCTAFGRSLIDDDDATAARTTLAAAPTASPTLTGTTTIVGAGITSAAAALNVTDSTNASLLYVRNDGNVGIGTTSPGNKLEVNGSFAATTKSFRIAHPSKPNHILEYGALESPYHGVRLTGRGAVIESRGKVTLPAYLKDLVYDDETLTIQITNYRHGKLLYVSAIDLQNDAFFVACDLPSNTPLEFFWSLTAVRKDVAPLAVEQEA